jgi:hypothetical protein
MGICHKANAGLKSMRKLYAIRNTTTGKYYSPNLDGKTQWANHDRAYVYDSYDLAAECSARIEEDDFEIVEFLR